MIDEIIAIDNDAAFKMARDMARRGHSARHFLGRAVAAALRIGARPDSAGKRIVVIIPSFAERYVSTPLFDGLLRSTNSDQPAGERRTQKFLEECQEGAILFVVGFMRIDRCAFIRQPIAWTTELDGTGCFGRSERKKL